MIWEGLCVRSTPAVNTGASEHNQIFGDVRVEINDANIYATIPAKDLRNDLELVRGLAADVARNDQGIDFSKAKAYCVWSGTNNQILASMNIKKLTNKGTGDNEIEFMVPFKDLNFAAVGMGAKANSTAGFMQHSTPPISQSYPKGNKVIRIANINSSGTVFNTPYNTFVAFGELYSD